MRGLGIDPGTRSFDLVVVEEGKVVWERSIDTVAVAKSPELLVEAVEDAGSIDIIAGPSGYGVPVTYNGDITDPRRFALQVILLTRERDLKSGIRAGELGIKVYEAITKVVVEFWRRKLPVCYIPSTILLPTVPVYRKINRLDMGTADKMSVTVLGVYNQSRRLGISYDQVNFILLEMGFGYNAVIAVENGRIVDGLGGTLVPTGFLTIGPVDAELAVMGERWARSDVFHGGVAEICGTFDIDEVLKRYEDGEEPCASAVRAMLDGVEKSVRGLLTSLRKPREILLSGRNSRNPTLRKLVEEGLEEIAPVEHVGNLPGAREAKEAAQGYAIVGEGLAGGFFGDLVKHMRIGEAKGTVLNWVYHPRLREAKEWLRRAYISSVRNPKL